MMPLLELKSIHRSYPSGEQSVEVLKDISLKINAGEMVAIMGASGSGKSTLMNILGCLDQPTTGTYLVNGQDVASLDNDELAILRREHFGFIFQRYHLLPHLNAAHNVEIPAIYAGWSNNKRHERASMLLTRLGLSTRANYRPNQLSGGQQQRVSIARALINGGQIILADEPTGALDCHSTVEVITILKQLQQQGHTVIIVTHDAQVAAQAERIIEISDGSIIADSGFKPSPNKLPTKSLSPKADIPSWQQAVFRLRESFLMAWCAMMTSKMRTGLTMLGIIIGIASVVFILVIGEAAQKKVLADIRAIGTNTIHIYPGEDYGDDEPSHLRSLTANDLEALTAQPYIDVISPLIASSMRLRSGNVDVAGHVFGVNGQYFHVFGMTMAQGSVISQYQVDQQSQVVVIDNNTQRLLFPHLENVVGQVILIGNMPATVIGVVKKKPSMFNNSETLQVWVPYRTMSKRLNGKFYFDSITVRIKDGYDSKDVEQKLVRLLTLRHGKKDIYTYNMDTLLQTAEKTTRTMQLFLTLVAVISLIVGGIGVMNIMLVSVTERTREIGIRMAVGARPGDIMQQFLIEAVLLCLVGGTLGVMLSLIVGLAMSILLPSWPIVFSPMAMLSAFLCSTVIGIVFGYLPARNAARLSPIEALARE